MKISQRLRDACSMAWLVGFHTGNRCCRVPGTRPAGKSTRRRRSRAGSRSRSRGTRRGPWRCIPLAKTPGPPIARRPCSSSTRSSRSRSKGPGLRGRRSRSHSHRTSSSRWRRRSTRSSRPCRTCTCVEIKIYGAFALNHRVVLYAIDATPARWRGDGGSFPHSGRRQDVPHFHPQHLHTPGPRHRVRLPQ